MIPDALMMGGLSCEHELFFPAAPENPDMRESTSVWLYEENGAFAFPRFGIEAEASAWHNHRVQANFAFADGRVLNGAGRSASHAPFGPDGQPRILGAGPLLFECIEPFRTWRARWDGLAVDGTIGQQISHTLDPDRKSRVQFDVEMTMVTPCWVQDFRPEVVARLLPEQQREVAHMGIGWRLEHLFRGEGTLTIDGKTRSFRALGSRIKRQSIRPLAGFRGHCWQSALFPDGRAFGYIAYPPRDDGSDSYNEGYVYQGGHMYPARASRIPWLNRIRPEGDDVGLELESELGTIRIEGLTALNTFRVNNPDLPGLHLHQGGACYSWDGQSAYGMIERSLAAEAIQIG